MADKMKCPVCGTEATVSRDFDRVLVRYGCPVCGRYELGVCGFQEELDENHLASYLLYHKFDGDFEYRYHTVLNKDDCDKYREEFDNGKGSRGRPVHMDADMIENWYPKTFSERVDCILLFLNSRIKHIGHWVTLNYQESLSALFVDRKELDESSSYGGVREWIDRDPNHCRHERRYMLDYLKKCSYIEYTNKTDDGDCVTISLTPEGYARVDMLQKNTGYGRNVFVAMQFSDTKLLREAIRTGIHNAGYIAKYIDEIPHNGFISPEILKRIRDSKFVVVDLTHNNNGAYFEEGYAMGLGKPVIQLCKKDTTLHFDIAQKNTIIWETEDDIPERLANRIKATID